MDFCLFPLPSQFKTVILASQPFIQEERRTNLHLTAQHMRLSNCALRGREPKGRWQGHKDHRSATGVYVALWCSILFLGTSDSRRDLLYSCQFVKHTQGLLLHLLAVVI